MSKKKKQMNFSNTVDINLHWRHTICDSEEYNSPACFYYLDKTNYEFVIKRFLPPEEQEIFDEQIGSRYIKLFQYIKESQYKSMLELIDNKEVTGWFLSAKSEEERYEKYRRFLDWNCLYEAEGHRLYLKIYPKFMEWCKENNLNVFFRGELSPPSKYIYSNQEELKSRKWDIPYEHNSMY